MNDLLVALSAAVLTTVVAVGVGSPLCFGAASWDRGRRWLFRLVLGLGLLPLLQLVLHELFGLPVRPAVALLLGIAGWVLLVVQERRWSVVDPEDGAALPLLQVLCVGLFFAALVGGLAQPGFEGLDPWRHAFGTSWLAESGLLRQPDSSFPLVHYVDAYPPLFDILLSLPAALLGHLPAAVKGVAALLVAVAPLALWLLARSLFEDSRRAILAAVLYALLPNAVSRHLWGHSLVIILVLGGLAAVLELRRDLRWWPAVAVAFGGAILAAPSQGLKAWILLLATASVVIFVDRRWLARLTVAAGAAAVLAGVWLLPAAVRHGFAPMALVRAMQPPELRRINHPLTRLDPGQEAPVPWELKPQDQVGWQDVLFFRPFSSLVRLTGGKRVNLVVTAGLGLPLLVMAAAWLIKRWRGPPGGERLLLTLWLATAALLTFGAPVGITFFAWRSWLLLAPCVALVAADGVLRLAGARSGWKVAALVIAGAHGVAALVFDLGTGLVISQWQRPAWLAVLAAAVWLTLHISRDLDRSRRAVVVLLVVAHLLVAAPVRAATLLDEVPPRVFFDRDEHRGYLELAERLRSGERVWPVSGGLRFDIVVGLGLGCTPFRSDELEMARSCSDGEVTTAEDLVAWAQQNSYRWLVLDPSFGELQRALGRGDGFDSLRRELDAFPGLTAVSRSGGFVVWRLPEESAAE